MSEITKYIINNPSNKTEIINKVYDYMTDYILKYNQKTKINNYIKIKNRIK